MARHSEALRTAYTHTHKQTEHKQLLQHTTNLKHTVTLYVHVLGLLSNLTSTKASVSSLLRSMIGRFRAAITFTCTVAGILVAVQLVCKTVRSLSETELVGVPCKNSEVQRSNFSKVRIIWSMW